MRDKLLGLSDKEDIDFSIDNMTGKEFAFYMNKWSLKNGKIQTRIYSQNVNENKNDKNFFYQLFVSVNLNG